VPLDIIVFAVIAAFLIYRLNSVLGTRSGSDRERPNPFAPPGQAAPQATAQVVELRPQPALAPAMLGEIIDSKANAEGRVEAGLADIAAADAQFEAARFIQGARAAFEMIVTSYGRGDLGALRPLLSPKLFADFKAGVVAREAAGHTAEVSIRAIKAARVIEAHLGGTMAYITVDFDVEETTVTRDAAGNVVGGSPDRVFSVEDIWTFTRDVRAQDPNWILIETRAVEK